MKLTPRELRRLILEELTSMSGHAAFQNKMPPPGMPGTTPTLEDPVADIMAQEAPAEEVQALTYADYPVKEIESEKKIFKALFKSRFSADLYKVKPSNFAGMPKEVRIAPADSLQPEITEQIGTKLIQDLGYQVLNVIPPQRSPPGLPGAMSSRRNTYLVSRGGAQFGVVFATANKGQKFEAELRRQMQQGGELADSLFAALKPIGFDASKIIKVRPAEKDRKRPLKIPMKDEGATISDITIDTTDKGSPYYLSIKNKDGATFSNPGYGGAIELCPRADESSPEMCQIGKTVDLDKLLVALGVDKNKIVQGINDFVSSTQSSPDLCAPITLKAEDFDTATVAEYLKASFGYGYIYARNKGGENWKILDLRKPESVAAIVGTPTIATISYARFNCPKPDSDPQQAAIRHWPSSKGTRIAVETSSGAKFDIAVRNKSGGTLPTQMAISIVEYPTVTVPINESVRNFSIHDFIYSDV